MRFPTTNTAASTRSVPQLCHPAKRRQRTICRSGKKVVINLPQSLPLSLWLWRWENSVPRLQTPTPSVPPSFAAPRYRNNSTAIAAPASKRVIRSVGTDAKNFNATGLLLLFPKLAYFSTQTIHVRKNYGLGDTTVPKFSSDCGNTTGFNRDNS